MYAITTTSRVNHQVYEPEFNRETPAMPRLNERKSDRIPTYLSLPRATRAGLEAAIDHQDIKSLTDAVVAAEKALTRQLKRKASKSDLDRPIP